MFESESSTPHFPSEETRRRRTPFRFRPGLDPRIIERLKFLLREGCDQPENVLDIVVREPPPE